MRFLISIVVWLLVSSIMGQPSYDVRLEAFSKENPAREIRNKGVISPRENIRILVTPKIVRSQPDETLSKDVLELQRVAIECNRLTNALIAVLSQPEDRFNVTAASTQISKNLGEIDKYFSEPNRGRLATDFYQRFQTKSERVFNVAGAINRENSAPGSPPTAPKIEFNVPVEMLVALNESLNEVIALAAEDTLREGTYVRVSLELFRNNDLSRIPDTEFLAPADQRSLAALMKIRDQLRGIQNPQDPQSGTKPIDVKNLSKLLVRRFEVEFKRAFERIQTELQNCIDGIKRAIESIESKINDSQLEQQFEQYQREADALVKRFQNVLETAKTLSKGQADESSPASDAALLSMWSQQLNLIKTESDNLGPDCRRFTERFGRWIDQLPETLKQSLMDLDSEVRDFITRSANAIRSLANSAVNEIQSVLRAQIEFLNLVNRLDKIDELTVDDVNGRVEILNKEGQLGRISSLLLSYDELVIRIQAHPSEEGDFAPVGEANGYRVGVFKNNRWDQLYSLTFSPRIGNGNRWQDALTYGQVFKKAYFSKSIHQNSFLPGFGWSMSVMDQNADSVRELGIGAMLTFFDDRLITGYGFNISEKHWYPYLGFRFRL